MLSWPSEQNLASINSAELGSRVLQLPCLLRTDKCVRLYCVSSVAPSNEYRRCAINHAYASVSDVIHQICDDFTHGHLAKSTSFTNRDIFAIDTNRLSVKGKVSHLTSVQDPTKINWAMSRAEYVVESAGNFTTKRLAKVHIEYGGAKRFLISHPVLTG